MSVFLASKIQRLVVSYCFLICFSGLQNSTACRIMLFLDRQDAYTFNISSLMKPTLIFLGCPKSARFDTMSVFWPLKCDKRVSYVCSAFLPDWIYIHSRYLSSSNQLYIFLSYFLSCQKAIYSTDVFFLSSKMQYYHLMSGLLSWPTVYIYTCYGFSRQTNYTSFPAIQNRSDWTYVCFLASKV